MIYINSFIDIIHEFQNIMCKRWTAYQALDCMNKFWEIHSVLSNFY